MKISTGPWTIGTKGADGTIPIMDADDCILASAEPALYHHDGQTEDRQPANASLLAQAARLQIAVDSLIEIIEAAGLTNLMTGVQLGQTAWYIKASDRIANAKEVLALSKGEH